MIELIKTKGLIFLPFLCGMMVSFNPRLIASGLLVVHDLGGHVMIAIVLLTDVILTSECRIVTPAL